MSNITSNISYTKNKENCESQAVYCLNDKGKMCYPDLFSRFFTRKQIAFCQTMFEQRLVALIFSFVNEGCHYFAFFFAILGSFDEISIK